MYAIRSYYDLLLEFNEEFVDHRQGQVPLGGKEVVEAPLLHAGVVADRRHTDLPVAAGVDQITGALEDALAGIGRAVHEAEL